MKQVTGSNPARNAYKVSIQLSLDGHSFSAPDLSAANPGDGPVVVELLTAKTMLVPAEAFDASCAGALLAAGGIPTRGDECVVHSDPGAETVAVMAVPQQVWELLSEQLGPSVRFTSPLLHSSSVQRPHVWVYRTAELLYIKVFDKGLQFAEVVPAPTEEDIRYVFERLSAEFPMKNYLLVAAGEQAERLCKMLDKGFKKTLCE